MASKNYVALDVGEKRIGVAVGDDGVRLAIAYETVAVDGKELRRLGEIIVQQEPAAVIIGYPRNQLGEATAQTTYVESFAKTIRDIAPKIIFQDESLTSVLAEERLKSQKKPYQKSDIDALAAAIILQDYLETYG